MNQNRPSPTITGALFSGGDLNKAISAAKKRNERRQTILAAHYMRLGYTALPALEQAQKDLSVSSK